MKKKPLTTLTHIGKNKPILLLQKWKLYVKTKDKTNKNNKRKFKEMEVFYFRCAVSISIDVMGTMSANIIQQF